MKNALILFTAVTFGLLSPASYAQHAIGSFARMVVLKPKPGQSAEFNAGYARHLRWHEERQDPWTWHGWTFVLGERVGQFMDGTFGHALTNFDRAVDPAGDSADNNVNVTPYADFVSHGIFERIEAASSGDLLPDKSPYLALTTYYVLPGQEAAFETTITTLARRAIRERKSWYRLRIGGAAPQYILVRAAQTFSGGAALPDVELPAGLVNRAQSELLRYQPLLSYVPSDGAGGSRQGERE